MGNIATTLYYIGILCILLLLYTLNNSDRVTWNTN